MSNLRTWDAVRAVPETAKKTITGGRLNGKTDINPMWRIKTLTEQYGPCGYGWRYEIVDKRLEKGNGDVVAAFVDINLFVNDPHYGWSAAIPGTGGSMFVATEKSGLYTSDECYKMALTDAISVACKALGFGADVYWQADATKYDRRPEPAAAPASPPASPPPEPPKLPSAFINEAQMQQLMATEDKALLQRICEGMGYKKLNQIKTGDFDRIVEALKAESTALPFDL